MCECAAERWAQCVCEGAEERLGAVRVASVSESDLRSACASVPKERMAQCVCEGAGERWAQCVWECAGERCAQCVWNNGAGVRCAQ